MLIGVITSTLSSYTPEVRRGATSGLQQTCLFDSFLGRPRPSLPGFGWSSTWNCRTEPRTEVEGGFGAIFRGKTPNLNIFKNWHPFICHNFPYCNLDFEVRCTGNTVYPFLDTPKTCPPKKSGDGNLGLIFSQLDYKTMGSLLRTNLVVFRRFSNLSMSISVGGWVFHPTFQHLLFFSFSFFFPHFFFASLENLGFPSKCSIITIGVFYFLRGFLSNFFAVVGGFSALLPTSSEVSYAVVNQFAVRSWGASWSYEEFPRGPNRVFPRRIIPWIVFLVNNPSSYPLVI